MSVRNPSARLGLATALSALTLLGLAGSASADGVVLDATHEDGDLASTTITVDFNPQPEPPGFNPQPEPPGFNPQPEPPGASDDSAELQSYKPPIENDFNPQPEPPGVEDGIDDGAIVHFDMRKAGGDPTVRKAGSHQPDWLRVGFADAASAVEQISIPAFACGSQHAVLLYSAHAASAPVTPEGACARGLLPVRVVLQDGRSFDLTIVLDADGSEVGLSRVTATSSVGQERDYRSSDLGPGPPDVAPGPPEVALVLELQSGASELDASLTLEQDGSPLALR